MNQALWLSRLIIVAVALTLLAGVVFAIRGL